MARRDKLTLRELFYRVAAARGHLLLVGTPGADRRHAGELVPRRRRRRLQRDAAVLPGQFDDFVDLVVPILQERGLFRADYAGTTLRDHLGLARPANRLSAPQGGPAFGDVA